MNSVMYCEYEVNRYEENSIYLVGGNWKWEGRATCRNDFMDWFYMKTVVGFLDNQFDAIPQQHAILYYAK